MADELAEALASTSLSSSTPRPTTLCDVPNDVLVSIFELTGDPRWAREEIPLVCKAWRDLYRTKDASPLHYSVNLSLEHDRSPRVLPWARNFQADVTELVIFAIPPGGRIRDFTEDALSELVTVVGPQLLKIWIDKGCGSLLRDRFWRSLRQVVVPAGRLQDLSINGITTRLSGRFATSLGSLTSLECLRLGCGDTSSEEVFRSDPAGDKKWGFSKFPESLLSLTKLTSLALRYHRGVVSLPAGISDLVRLRNLFIENCSLSSLPAELGKLSGLTSLNVSFNPGLGAAPEATAFPAALRGLRSLRELSLTMCFLRAVPSFVGSLTSLEELAISGSLFENTPNRGFPPSFSRMTAVTELALVGSELTAVPPGVLTSLPALKVLRLTANKLKKLPKDFGRRLSHLEQIKLSKNRFESVPVDALAGATALEFLDLSENEGLQVDRSLDPLLQKLPRLHWVRMGKRVGTWSPKSRRFLEEFASKLHERDPTVPERELFEV